MRGTNSSAQKRLGRRIVMRTKQLGFACMIARPHCLPRHARDFRLWDKSQGRELFLKTESGKQKSERGAEMREWRNGPRTFVSRISEPNEGFCRERHSVIHQAPEGARRSAHFGQTVTPFRHLRGGTGSACEISE
jgi:hypothetical protein